MTEKYVLTGGPGSGKSSIILALEMKGEYVINEAAEDYIRYRQAQGVQKPWTENDFQDKILELQVQREGQMLFLLESSIVRYLQVQAAAKPAREKRVFIDRGIPDGLAYVEPGSSTYKNIIRESGKSRYDKVFLVEPLADIQKDNVRREDRDEAMRLHKKIEEIYTGMGYKPVKIPAGELDTRVKMILSEINRR